VKSEIISNLAKDPFYTQYAKDLCLQQKMRSDAYLDLLQYVWLYLSEKSEEEIIQLSKENLKGYVCRIIWINSKSDTSPFKRNEFKYNLLEKDVKLEESDIDKEIIIRIAEDFFKKEVEYWSKEKNLPAWNVRLLELYAEMGSYRKVEQATGINFQTVRHTVLELIKRINEDIANNGQK